MFLSKHHAVRLSEGIVEQLCRRSRLVDAGTELDDMQASVNAAADTAAANDADLILVQARVDEARRENGAGRSFRASSGFGIDLGQVAVRGPVRRAVAAVEDAQVAEEDGGGTDGSSHTL